MSRTPSVLGPSIWMMVVSLLLCWVPGFGPLIAGYVGGKRAGDVSHAILAALFPMVVVGVFAFVMLTVVGVPIIGVVVGGAIAIYLIAIETALFAGAIIGGLMADKD